MTNPSVHVTTIVVNCSDPSTVAVFWQAMLGGRILSYPEHRVEALRAPGITFDFVATTDTKTASNRLHLDLATDDPSGAVRYAVSRGATMADDYARSPDFTVLRDPEGNEFCILTNAPATGPWQPPPGAQP